MRMIHALQFSAKSLNGKGVPPSRNSVIAQIEHIHSHAHTLNKWSNSTDAKVFERVQLVLEIRVSFT